MLDVLEDRGYDSDMDGGVGLGLDYSLRRAHPPLLACCRLSK